MSDLIALLDATLRLISNNNNNSNGSGTTAAAAAERKKLSRLSVHGVKPGGYPVEMFLDGLSQQEKENYQCGICFLIAKNPCHCLNRHQFCRSCVTVWAGSGESENHNKCPVCRVKGYYLPSGRVADALNSMTVRCLLRSCVWTGQLRDMQYHRHILSKKIAEESSCRVYRKNSSTSDESSESDTCESQTPSPSSSPVLPRITASSKHVATTVPVSGATPLSVRLSGHEWDSVRPPASNATFLQLLHSASSSVDMPPRDTSQNGQSVSDSVFSASTMVVPDSADLAPEVRCCTPRPRSSTPTTNLRSSTQLPASVIVINNNNNNDNNNNNNMNNNNSNNNNNNNIINNNIVNRTAASNYNANTFGPTAGFSVRSAVAPRTSNAGSENSLPSLNPEQQPEPVYCRGSTRRTGPKEYERLRARMRETRVRLEQMEITRRELARFQERQRLQHLVEVRGLGRQLNEVTFQIRRLLNRMSTADDSTTASTSTTTRTNHRNSNDDN